MKPPTLKEQYETACQTYAGLLLEKFDTDWDDAFWIGDEIGGTLDIACEWSFSMKDIEYAIDNDMSTDELTDWYNYVADAQYTEVPHINLRSWHTGAPRISAKVMRHLWDLKWKVDDAKMTLELMGESGGDKRVEEQKQRIIKAQKTFDAARHKALAKINIFPSKINSLNF